MQLRRNDPAALPAFARLNLNRIEELHVVEDSDRAMGEDPSLYIAPGNYMLSLHAGETVAGVVALKRDGDGAYELTKLAVDAACHRLGWTQFLDGEHPKYSRCNLGFEKTL